MAEKKRERETAAKQPDRLYDAIFKAPNPAPNLKSSTLFDEPYIEPLGSMNDIYRRYIKQSQK